MANRTIEVEIKAKAGQARGEILQAANAIAGNFDKIAQSYDQTATHANKLRLVQLQLASAQIELRGETDELRKAQLQVKVDDLTNQYIKLGTAVEDTGDAISETVEDSQEAAGGFKAFGLSLTDLKSGLDLAMGAARTAQQALKAVYDTAREGAVIGAVTDRFEAFAGGAENASDYLRVLRQETNYTVSEMEAMTAVTKLLSMGLAEDEQSAANLAKMAIILGDQTQSAGDRITDFALMLANQSIPRLDNYGISSGKVRARIEELMAATEGMTREQAFMNAVTEQGAIAMNTLGGEVSGNLSAYQQLEAAFKDATDAGKEWVAEGLTPAVKAAADLFTAGQRLDDMLADHQDEALKSGKAWNDYARQQITAARAAKGITGDYADFLNDLDRALEKNGVSLAERSELLADDNKVMELAIELGIGLRDQLDRTSYNAIIAGMRAATQGYSDMGMGAHNLAREMAGTTEQLITNFGDIAQAGEASKQAMSDLATVMRGELGNAWDEFSEQQTEAAGKVQELTAKIGELEAIKDPTKDQRESLAELRGELAEVNAAVEENAVAHEEATKRILFGYMEQRLGLDGLTEAELQALTDVAAAWGLIDQKTYDTIVAIDAAADAFEAGKTDIADYGQELRIATGHASGLYEWLHKIPPRLSLAVDISVYGAENLPPAFSPGGTPNTSLPAVPMAAGGDFLVTRPTLFLAGEAGPERATFTPQGGIGGGGGANAGMTVNIYTQQSTGSIYRDLQLVEAML